MRLYGKKLLLACALTSLHAQEKPVSFAADIRPVLETTCWKCHGSAFLTRVKCVRSYNTKARISLQSHSTTTTSFSKEKEKMNRMKFSYLKLAAVAAVLAITLIGLSGLLSMTTSAQDRVNLPPREIDLRAKLKEKKFADGSRVEIHAFPDGQQLPQVRSVTGQPEQVQGVRHPLRHQPLGEVAEQFGAVHLVINNAGIAFTGDVAEMTFSDIERIMDVDFWGVVNGTKAFLPHLIASGDGTLVNISSLFGLMSVPSQGAYNAAKFAVRGFTEALRQEMLIAGHPVRVTCVHPGGIKTAIARNAGAVPGRDATVLGEFFDRRLAKTSADRAARTILRAAERGRARVLVGVDAWVLDLFVRVTGSGYQRIGAALTKRLAPQPKQPTSRS